MIWCESIILWVALWQKGSALHTAKLWDSLIHSDSIFRFDWSRSSPILNAAEGSTAGLYKNLKLPNSGVMSRSAIFFAGAANSYSIDPVERLTPHDLLQKLSKAPKLPAPLILQQRSTSAWHHRSRQKYHFPNWSKQTHQISWRWGCGWPMGPSTYDGWSIILGREEARFSWQVEGVEPLIYSGPRCCVRIVERFGCSPNPLVDMVNIPFAELSSLPDWENVQVSMGSLNEMILQITTKSILNTPWIEYASSWA